MTATRRKKPAAKGKGFSGIDAPRKTAGYVPMATEHAVFWDERDKYFTWYDVPRMKRDPQVLMGLRILEAPLHGVERKVRANHPTVEAFIEATLNRVWQRALRKISKANEYGHSPGEIEYKIKGRRYEFKQFHAIHPMDGRPLRNPRTKEIEAVRIRHVEGREGTLADIAYPNAFWLANDSEFGQPYGQSRLAGAWQPWMEKSGRHGANDIRRLWFLKNAYNGGILRYPDGFTELEDGRQVSNQDLAREILEKLETGGVLVLPNTRSGLEADSPYAWEYTTPEMNGGDLAGILEYPDKLDKAIFAGMGIPNELIEAGVKGSWSGRSIPAQMFFSSLDVYMTVILDAICRLIITPLVRVNYGSKAEYEVTHEPMAEQVANQPESVKETVRGQDTNATPGADPMRPQQQPMAAAMQQARLPQQRMSVNAIIDRYPKLVEKIRRRMAGSVPTNGNGHAAEMPLRDVFGKTRPNGEQRIVPVRLAGDRGHWITIGGKKGADGKRHGGSPVFIKDGQITKGHPNLTGKKIGEGGKLHEGESTHRQEMNWSKGHAKATWAKRAKTELGIDPEHLHGLAADMRAHDKEYKDDIRNMLSRARELGKHYGVDLRKKGKDKFVAGTEGHAKSLDVISRSVAGEYPHIFGGRGYESETSASDEPDYTEMLHEYLTGGDPEYMTEDEAHEHAFEHIQQHGSVPKASHEPIPLSIDAGGRHHKPKGTPEGGQFTGEVETDLFGNVVPKKFTAGPKKTQGQMFDYDPELNAGAAWMDAAKDLASERGERLEAMEAGQRAKIGGKWYDVKHDGEEWKLEEHTAALPVPEADTDTQGGKDADAGAGVTGPNPETPAAPPPRDHTARIRDLYDRSHDTSIPMEHIEETFAPLEDMSKRELLAVAERLELAGMEGKNRGEIAHRIKLRILDRRSAAHRDRMITERFNAPVTGDTGSFRFAQPPTYPDLETDGGTAKLPSGEILDTVPDADVNALLLEIQQPGPHPLADVAKRLSWDQSRLAHTLARVRRDKLATLRMSTDAHGREHKGKGTPEGGQFTGHGEGDVNNWQAVVDKGADGATDEQKAKIVKMMESISQMPFDKRMEHEEESRKKAKKAKTINDDVLAEAAHLLLSQHESEVEKQAKRDREDTARDERNHIRAGVSLASGHDEKQKEYSDAYNSLKKYLDDGGEFSFLNNVRNRIEILNKHSFEFNDGTGMVQQRESARSRKYVPLHPNEVIRLFHSSGAEKEESAK